MKRIAVFCGSRRGEDPEFARTADALGVEIVRRGIELVFGGGNVGLMGVVADAVLASGGRAVGVIPKGLLDREVGHRGLTELIVVKTMHERKATIARMSEGFVALPGGIGTFEEILEIWTWAQLGMHAKPIGILNVHGYYDKLVAFLDHAVDQGFFARTTRDMLIVEEDPATLLDSFVAYQGPSVRQWIDEGET